MGHQHSTRWACSVGQGARDRREVDQLGVKLRQLLVRYIGDLMKQLGGAAGVGMSQESDVFK